MRAHYLSLQLLICTRAKPTRVTETLRMNVYMCTTSANGPLACAARINHRRVCECILAFKCAAAVTRRRGKSWKVLCMQLGCAKDNSLGLSAPQISQSSDEISPKNWEFYFWAGNLILSFLRFEFSHATFLLDVLFIFLMSATQNYLTAQQFFQLYCRARLWADAFTRSFVTIEQ
jgi:hypothetical protein